MKSNEGYSSTGKWFSLIVIAATGVVASLPFQNSSPITKRTNSGYTSNDLTNSDRTSGNGVSLRIFSDEPGSDIENAPRPVSTPRISGASLQQPAREPESQMAVDQTGPEVSDSDLEQRNVKPIRQPTWEQDKYPAPPFVTKSSDDAAVNEDETHEQESPKQEPSEQGPSEGGDSDESPNDIASRYGQDETSGDGTVSESDNPYGGSNAASLYGASKVDTGEDNAGQDNSNRDAFGGDAVAGSDTEELTETSPAEPESRYGNGDTQEPRDAQEPRNAENEGVLPTPKTETLASEDKLPAPANSDDSVDELPPPRPRLTISEDRLPAPRRSSKDSTIADDGFRPIRGRNVAPPDARRPHDDGTIRPPVTRLVRLGPPDEKSKTIRAPQFHIVRDGDSLDGLAETYWGDKTRWRAIFSANRNIITNPELLPIGAKLRIPNDDFYRTLRRK